MTTYTYVPHPHTLERLEPKDKPVKTADVAKKKATNRFNAWLAVKITDGVGTMWCAYIFAIITFIGLPTALKPGGEGLIRLDCTNLSPAGFAVNHYRRAKHCGCFLRRTV